MASTKRSTKSVGKNEANKDKEGYVWQHFTPKAIALIQKYNLQVDENYKKLISSYERIKNLPKEDERKLNLVELWETEFNRLFKEFWLDYSSEIKKIDKGIGGWKERLNVKPEATSPDAKRQLFMSRLTGTNISARNNVKEEILNRAGYKKEIDVEQFNFTAQPKTGKNILELESMLDDVENVEMTVPESILSKKPSNTSRAMLLENDQDFTGDLDFEETPNHTISDFDINMSETSNSEPVPDPSLEAFVNDNEPFVNDSISLDEDLMSSETSNLGEESNVETTINTNVSSNDNQIGMDFYQKNMSASNGPFDYKYQISTEEKLASIENTEIDPEKRNIHSKDGFEINTDYEKKLTEVSEEGFEAEESDSKTPYHEIRPIGNYEMSFDLTKRPSMQDIIESNESENRSLDEMTEKLEFLRELRAERRHRITMMKLERSNSYIVARARRMAESRELNRLKKREEINLKAIERADRMRRMNERQRLIELMKERQIKRSEEKRIAQVLRLERQRRFERDAKYRTEIASIDAQIRYEQELIKRTELKMKAYFSKVNDDRIFEESLKSAKKTSKYSALEKKAEAVAQIEQSKRKDRIEKISRKFTKNIK